jgi:MoxR-like ATPase
MTKKADALEEVQKEESLTTGQTAEFNVEIQDIDLPALAKETVSKFASDALEEVQKALGDAIALLDKEAISQVKADAEKALERMVKDEVLKLTPTYVSIAGREQVKLEGRLHKRFSECLVLCEQERQMFLSGPAGSGKTTLASQIAEAFKLQFAHLSCSAGMSEAHLLGRMLFDGTYAESEFVKLYEGGGVFLFDEVDAADANTLLVINSALANGYLSLPNRRTSQTAKRSPDFICIVAGNTWGGGSFEYHGRNHLDAAFLDRFCLAKVEVEYDVELEEEIAANKVLSKLLHSIRKATLDKKVRRVISTRLFVSAKRLMSAGYTYEDVLARLTLGWNDDEKDKVMQSITIPKSTASEEAKSYA